MTELSREAIDSIKDLKQVLNDIDSRLENAEQRSTVLQETTVSRKELQARRIQTAIVALGVTLLVVIPLGTWQFREYERRYNAMVTKCFITQTQQTESDKARCDRKFPGYTQAKVQGELRLQQFTNLVTEIPANTQFREESKTRIAELERKVTDLEGQR